MLYVVRSLAVALFAGCQCHTQLVCVCVCVCVCVGVCVGVCVCVTELSGVSLLLV